MNSAYLSLGTNIGDRDQHLQDAIHLLQQNDAIRVTDLSSLYETEPVGYTDQAAFLNMALKIETSLSPDSLLDACMTIEQALGRERVIHWGPRTIDLDILLYNHDNIKTDRLIVPHPRMTERAFVLIPLAEIDGAAEIPGTGTALAQYVQNVHGKEGVKLWKQRTLFAACLKEKGDYAW